MHNNIQKSWFPGVPTGFLLLLYPIVVLTIHDAGNAILYLLLLISFTTLALRKSPGDVGFSQLARPYWPLYLAMMSAALAVFLNQISSGHFAFKFYDRALRLAVFPFVFWLMLFVRIEFLRLIPWSFAAAALLLSGKAYVFTNGGILRDGNIGFLSIIAYSDIALLFGVMGCIALGSLRAISKWQIGFCCLGLIAGIYTSVLTQTRGGWLGLLLFVLFFFVMHRLALRYKFMCVVALLMAVSLMFSIDDTARTRLLETGPQISNFKNGTDKTSAVGLRLQLWDAALQLFAEAPVFGIGRENYEPRIKEMADRHEVTEDLTTLAHSHNEILFNMVISGLFGLLSILAIYVVPGWYFARDLHHEVMEVRAAAWCGCLLVIGFFAFGLTDLMFFWPVLNGLYVILMAAFLSKIVKYKRDSSGLQLVI